MGKYRKNMTDEQKQKYRETGKHKYQNMTVEQKQKYIEGIKNHKKEHKKNMTDEQKQKQKDYQREYKKT